MIKMNILLGSLCIIFIAASLSSCNDYDTVVVGGGIAGVSAAASAAKNGSKTLIIESATFLGGFVTMVTLES